MFARLVGSTNRYAPATCHRRAYSFFSSKAGGGRYFNSAKPHNSKVVAGTGKTKAEPANGDDAVKPSPSSSAGGVEEASARGTQETCNASSRKPASAQQPIEHAPITPHDLNLHNFFSIHRPLLLLSQPTSTLFETPPAINFTAPPQNHAPPVPTGVGSFEDIPEASPEADADTARLLARALVVNRLGATVSWEHTLKQLGLDVDGEREVEHEALMDDFNAYMDSTKRKRRRKMKKHKLKKRRRLQRSQRIKIGK